MLFQTCVFSAQNPDSELKEVPNSKLTVEPLDFRFPISEQLKLDTNISPVILNIQFDVDPADVDQFIKAWAKHANWIKTQPGFISAQFHKGMGDSCLFFNYATWETLKHYSEATSNPEFSNFLKDYPQKIKIKLHLFSKFAISNVCTN